MASSRTPGLKAVVVQKHKLTGALCQRPRPTWTDEQRTDTTRWATPGSVFQEYRNKSRNRAPIRCPCNQMRIQIVEGTVAGKLVKALGWSGFVVGCVLLKTILQQSRYWKLD